ncbi:MAG: sensor histidine kinase [Comamonadaceae bacterium]|nr:MAG: sensor histidine kinase [Comamonadaceae bacterium]
MQSRFKLIQYFTATSLVAFGFVAVTLVYFQMRQSDFFKSVQTEEIRSSQETHGKLISNAEQVARRDLLSIHENGNVNLTRLFSNALWASDFAPFVDKTSAIDFERCRSMGNAVDSHGATVAGPEKKACFQAQGELIRALPQFAALDARVRASMRGSSVFKIKVYDLKGITIYSTEHAQIGDDKSGSPGWIGAALHGKAVSELTFRDKFSALQGVVENRDLIASYLPVIEPGTERVVGVFELYSDVTPFLQQIKATSQAFQKTADENQQRASLQAENNQEQVDHSSRTQLLVLALLLTLLYVVLLVIVRRAQRVIEKQAQESDTNKQRLAQAEKMTTLGQMVAGVAHQLNTPLAFSKSNVFMAIQSLDTMVPTIEAASRVLEKEIAGDPDITQPTRLDGRDFAARLGDIPGEARMAQEMLGDVLMGLDQMNELVNNLRNFTRLDRARTAAVDLNSTLSSVVYIAKSVISTKVRVVEAFEDLPPLECNVSQLNQVFLNLIVNAAQSIRGAGTITVTTSSDRERICVAILDTGSGIPDDVLPRIFDPYFTTKPAGEGTGLGLAIAKDIVVEHGGEIVVDTQVGVGTRFRIYLPLQAAR